MIARCRSPLLAPVAALCTLLACGPSAEPTQRLPSDSPPDATLPGSMSASVRTAQAVSSPAPAAPPTSSSSARATGAGRCVKNADCGWDSACFATKCLLGARPVQACDESAPPPGRCDCLAGQCAVVYKGTSGKCASDADCGWDDPCMPRSCRKGPQLPRDCDKSFPPPGDCVCVDHVCASVSL